MSLSIWHSYLSLFSLSTTFWQVSGLLLQEAPNPTADHPHLLERTGNLGSSLGWLNVPSKIRA